MKKFCYLMIIALMLAGCGGKQTSDSHAGSSQNSVSDVISEQIQEYNGDTPVVLDDNVDSEGNENTGMVSEYEEPDLDLSFYSASVIFGKINEIAENYEDYIGQVIKIKGVYNKFYNPRDDYFYFVCIVQDQTACCSSGLEFILKDEYQYPDDYPIEEKEIIVTGILETYDEGSQKFLHLVNAEYCYVE